MMTSENNMTGEDLSDLSGDIQMTKADKEISQNNARREDLDYIKNQISYQKGEDPAPKNEKNKDCKHPLGAIIEDDEGETSMRNTGGDRRKRSIVPEDIEEMGQTTFRDNNFVFSDSDEGIK